MLFYPFEKKFNLPTLSIKFRYSKCRKFEVINQKSIYGTLLFRVIFIDYEPHFIRIVFRNSGARAPYYHVTDNTSLLIHFIFLDNFIFHVILSSSYIEYITLLKVVVRPIEIHITFIQKIINFWLYMDYIEPIYIIDFAFCKPYESRNRTTKIYQSVHLESSFVMMKLSPRAKAQAKFNSATTIKGIYHFFEANSEIIILIQITCSLDENLCKIFINQPIFIFSHLCKSRFGYELQSPNNKAWKKMR